MTAPFGIIDIGTNSIRLGVIQPEGGLDYSVLSLQKETVRLGEGEFASNTLTEAAMERAILVLAKFAEVARGYGVEDLRVLGTAALREAHNQAEFVRAARERAGVEVTVISGAEEARLIYLGVVSGVELGEQRALVIDIGGGSTELAVGGREEPTLLESLKLGAIRVAGIFTEGETGPVSPQLYRRIQEYARGVAVHSVQRVGEIGFDVVYGSSGTITNLAEIVARSRGETSGGASHYFVRLADLDAAAQRLCAVSLEQRRRTPGINPERADIIVAGAAVLTALLHDLGAPGLHVSDRALREGAVADCLLRATSAAKAAESVRSRSVFQLARKCQFEEEHALSVAGFACTLFDQFRALGLHTLDEAARELLYHAAILHDIGGFISYSDHHRHGHYLVRHSPLLGFDGAEIQMMAAMVLHHRKSLPKRRAEPLEGLSRRQRETVWIGSMLLRLAESMDRGHLADVLEVRSSVLPDGAVRLELVSTADCHLAVWGLRNQLAAFEEVFNRRLDVETAPPPA